MRPRQLFIAWPFALLLAGLPTIGLLSTPAYAASATFAIDPQTLDGALKAFGVQSHREIFFAPELTRGKNSRGVRGQFDDLQALDMILAGTGLSYSVTASGALLIRDPAAKIGQTATRDEAGADEQALSEIVVTATRRSENVQDVPISITALSQGFIQNTGSQQIQDVVRAIPGLAFDPNTAGSAALSIRGVSTSSSTGNTQSPVAFYLDEVSLIDPSAPHEVPALSLFDVNRVEVLRGPQGTLFGAGALGGAIRVITNKPDATQFEAAIEETVEGRARGDMSYLTHLMVNVPLIDNSLALRVVGFFDHEGGWVDNSTRGETDVNHQELEGGRAQLRWTPSEELTLTATYSDEIDRPYDSAFSSYANRNYTFDGAVRQFAQEDTRIYNFVVDYRMPWATLTSSTTYTDREQKEQTDATALVGSITGLGAPAPVIDTGPSGDFIQEIRLASSQEHPYKWLVGAYFQTFHRRLLETIAQAGAGAEFAPVGFPSDIVSSDDINFKVHEDALFGEASYDLTSQLTLTAGARIFHETVASTSNGDGVFNGGPNSFESAASYNKTTPKVVLSYTPIKDIMFYAQAAEGYRAGQGNLGPGTDPASGLPIPSTYGPDHLWNYELGAKTTLLDRRLIVDADIYYIDWKQIQLTQRSVPSGFVYTANAGDALIRGAELQIVAKPIVSTEFGAALSYHDGRLTRVDPGVDALRGDQLPGSARFTAYLYGQYDFQISGALTSFVRADYSFTGREYSDLDNPTSLVYGDYREIGAQIGLTYKNFDLLLFGKNLANGDGLVNARELLNIPLAIQQAPRTIGLTFRAHY